MGRASTYDKEAVTKIILEAMMAEIPVLRTLQEVFEVDIATARWLQRWARTNGSMGYRHHRPVRAVIRRGSPHEKAWLVCQTCTDHWPCHAARMYALVPVASRHRRGLLREPAQQED